MESNLNAMVHNQLARTKLLLIHYSLTWLTITKIDLPEDHTTDYLSIFGSRFHYDSSPTV
jgi:hypothetical protein